MSMIDDYNNIIPSQTSSFGSFKITEDDLVTKGIQSGGVERVMRGNVEQNRQAFDKFPAFIANQYNNLLRFLSSTYAGGKIGVSVSGYQSQNLNDILAEINSHAEQTAQSKVEEMLGDNFTFEDGYITGLQVNSASMSAGIVNTVLSGYNSDNQLASFGEITSSDSVGIAIEKLYKGITNLNDGNTVAKTAENYDTTNGTIKTAFSKIANMASLNANGYYVAYCARDYDSSYNGSGGIATALNSKLDKTSISLNGTVLTITI